MSAVRTKRERAPLSIDSGASAATVVAKTPVMPGQTWTLEKELESAKSLPTEEDVYPTPAFVILVDDVRANCLQISQKAKDAGLALRPHAKTSKLVEVARIQTEHGPWPIDGEAFAALGCDSLGVDPASGDRPAVVASTLAECEALITRGFKDVLYAMPIDTSQPSLGRLLSLHAAAPRFRLLVDSPAQIVALESTIQAAALAGKMPPPVKGVDVPGVVAAHHASKKAAAPGVSSSAGAARATFRRVSVFLALDCGYGREGIDVTVSAAAAVPLARAVHTSDCLSLAGVYSHSGDSYNTAAGAASAAAVALLEAQRAGAAAAAIRSAGVPVHAVSVGSTPSVCAPASLHALRAAGATEVHPGNYALLDRQQRASGSVQAEAAASGPASAASSSSAAAATGAAASPGLRVACHVLARVLAHYPSRNEMLINAGGTALHKDSGGAGVEHWGELRGTGGRVVVTRISQEHGILSTADGTPLPWQDLPVGALVRVLPNHSCMTACMHELHHVVDASGSVLDVWRPARGW